MEDEPVTRMGVSLPPNLLEGFDEMIGRMGYANRSEAVRDAIRYYMVKNEPVKGRKRMIGVVSIVYDHDVHGVSDILTDLQHKYHHLIQSSIHLHLDEHNCLELVIVKGEVSKINEIRDRLTSVAGVKQTELLVTGSIGGI